jgi:uncharacterized iron-regulated membrane protein
MRFLHRCVAIFALTFLVIFTATGLIIGSDEVALRLSGKLPPDFEANGLSLRAPSANWPSSNSGAESIAPEDLSRMLATGLRAAARVAPGRRLLVVKLRIAQGMKQAIVWTDQSIPQQYVFDTSTGALITPDSAGQQSTGYMWPWAVHQLAKRIHRGDWLGLSGRCIDVVAGLSLLFLAISGLVMYLQMLGKRRRSGRRGLIWG